MCRTESMPTDFLRWSATTVWLDELGLDDDPVFGFFGSLYRYEGVAWLIRAAAELYSRGNRFKVLIIGSGEDEKAICNAIRECGAAGYVRTINHVPHDEIRRYYSVVDVMVFPRLSVRLTELVTPLKPLEAMSLKKAVLASSVGGHRDFVEHEGTGLLFRPEDILIFVFRQSGSSRPRYSASNSVNAVVR